MFECHLRSGKQFKTVITGYGTMKDATLALAKRLEELETNGYVSYLKLKKQSLPWGLRAMIYDCLEFKDLIRLMRLSKDEQQMILKSTFKGGLIEPKLAQMTFF